MSPVRSGGRELLFLLSAAAARSVFRGQGERAEYVQFLSRRDVPNSTEAGRAAKLSRVLQWVSGFWVSANDVTLWASPQSPIATRPLGNGP